MKQKNIGERRRESITIVKIIRNRYQLEKRKKIMKETEKEKEKKENMGRRRKWGRRSIRS